MIDGPDLPRSWRLTDLHPLHGGVSGATVLRGRLADSGRDVVVKHTDRLEADVLGLIAELNDPLFPRLLEVSDAGEQIWLMMDFHDGPPAGISADLSVDVHRAMGRLHGYFAERKELFPATAERVDRSLVLRWMGSFGPDRLNAAADLLSEDLRATGLALMRRLADDERFLTCGSRLGSTVLHGDLYGLNVLLPSATAPAQVIDWNTTRVGPAMFDVAMSAPYGSPARRAHDAGWTEQTGRAPDPEQDRLAHAWCSTMINIGYAGVVAVRSTPAEGAKMIMTAIAEAELWERLNA